METDNDAGDSKPLGNTCTQMDQEIECRKNNDAAKDSKDPFGRICYIFLGIQAAQKGPSFLDLQLISGTNVGGASYYFAASSFGYMMGAVATGFLYDRLGNSLLLMNIPLTLASLVIGLTPWCTVYTAMLLAHFAASFLCVFPDTTLTADELHLWKEKGDTVLLLLSFLYSLGGVISPLYTEPFLAPVTNSTVPPQPTRPSDNFTQLPYNASSTSFNSSAPGSTLEHGSQLHYAYLITAVFGVASAVPFYFLSIKHCAPSKMATGKRKPEVLEIQQRRMSVKSYIMFIAIACAFFFLYNMAEDSFNFFVAMFVVSHLSWSKENAALLVSLYWGLGVMSKLSMAILSRRVDVGMILLLCNLVMVLSFVGFIIGSHFDVDVMIWISSSSYALGQAPIFGGCCAWINSNILKMDGKATSAVMVFTSFGSMAGPIVLGVTIDRISLMVFPYAVLMQAVLGLGLFVFMLFFLKPFVASHYGSPGTQEESNLRHKEELETMPCEIEDTENSVNNGKLENVMM